MRCVSPWYNHTGWQGVKHQLTYLPARLEFVAGALDRDWSSGLGLTSRRDVGCLVWVCLLSLYFVVCFVLSGLFCFSYDQIFVLAIQ